MQGKEFFSIHDYIISRTAWYAAVIVPCFRIQLRMIVVICLKLYGIPFYNSWSSKWLTIDKATYIAICANSKKSNRWKTSTIMCCNDVLRIFLMFYSVFTKIFCMMCRYSIINMTFIRAWLVITLGLHHRLWLKWKEESIQGIENRRINRSAS